MADGFAQRLARLILRTPGQSRGGLHFSNWRWPYQHTALSGSLCAVSSDSGAPIFPRWDVHSARRRPATLFFHRLIWAVAAVDGMAADGDVCMVLISGARQVSSQNKFQAPTAKLRGTINVQA